MRPTTILAVVGTALALSNVARSEIEGELAAGWNTEYIWRGADQGGDSMIEAALTLGTEWNGVDFSANVWYATVNGTRGDFDEVDYTLGASKDISLGAVDLNLATGYIYYDFPTGGANLQEIYFGASTSWRDISFGYVYYWDIDGDNDGYSEFTADYSRALNDELTLNLGATLSYDMETSRVHHYGGSVGLDYAFNDVLTVSPYVSVTFADSGVRSGALSTGTGQGDELFGGIILSAGF